MPTSFLIAGRLVQGHPMQRHANTDDQGKPKMQKDGVTPSMNCYVGVAVPKGPEQSWQQTPWGAQIVAAALEGWTNGEHNAPAFAWKVEDGDSQIPNKKGRKNAEQEGFPGHWIVKASTNLGLVPSYKDQKYGPLDQLQDEGLIKRGDYCNVRISAKHNAPAQSPGVYLNPDGFELTRAGAAMASSAPSGQEMFGGGAPAAAPPVVAPAAAPPVVAPAAAPPAPAPAPAPEFLNPARPALLPACPYTYEQLDAGGWTEDQLRQHGYIA